MKAPTCPNCSSNAQVWISNGEFLCHRYGCHIVVDFEPHEQPDPNSPSRVVGTRGVIDTCRHGRHRWSIPPCIACQREAVEGALGELHAESPKYPLTDAEKAERERLSAEAAKAFNGTAAEARELLIRFIIGHEYICDSDGLFDNDMSRNSAIAWLQHGALLACAYTNKDEFRSKEEAIHKETTTLERLNKTLADREKLRGELKREQDRALQLVAERDAASKRADTLRGVLIEIYKITVGIEDKDIGTGPSDQFLAWVPDELRAALAKLKQP